MDAVWALDGSFLINFGKAIKKESGANSNKARIYRFLRQNAEVVEQCRTVAEIRKLPGSRPTTPEVFTSFAGKLVCL